MIAPLIELIAAHGGMLLLGSTVVLATGSAAVAVARAPLVQQRLAELTVIATLLWLGLALVPLPRVAWGEADAGAGESVASPPLPGAPRLTLRDPDPEPAHGDEGATREEVRSDPASPSAVPPSGRPDEKAAGDSLSVLPALSRPAWPRLLAGAVLAAGALASAWLLLGVARVTWIVAAARPTPARVTALAREVLGNPAQRRVPRVRMSSIARGPFCTGFPRPTVVLPAALATAGDEEPLRAVLAHELAHLRRGDVWSHTLFALALPVLVLHPLFWWICHRAHVAAELLADDAAAAVVGKRGYVRAFIELAARQAPARDLLVGVTAFRSPSEFYQRMHMLLERPDALASRLSRGHRVLHGVLATILVAGSTALVGVRDLTAQEPADLKQQFDALRHERDQLRAEIQELRNLLREAAPALDPRESPTAAHTTSALPPGDPATRDPRRAPSQPDALFAEVPYLRDLFTRPPAGAPPEGGPAQPGQPSDPNAADLPPAGTFARTQPGRERVRNTIPDAAANPFLAGGNERWRNGAFPDAAPRADNTYVLDLLTRAIDLSSEVELLRERLSRQDALGKSGHVSQEEVAATRTSLKANVRKLELVQRLIRSEQQATERELAHIAGQLKGSPGNAALEMHLIRTETRLQILQQSAR